MKLKAATIPAAILIAVHMPPAFAKSIGDALSDMGLQDSDPRGVILMVVCICLLVALATSLIFTTLRVGSHKKKPPKDDP